MRTKNGYISEEFMVVIAICGILAVIFFPSIMKSVGVTIMPKYSEGSRTGVVVKLSKKGVFYKTWEGTMNVGSMSADGEGVATPTEFDFSVADNNIVEKIQNATSGGKRITLVYEQALLQPWSKGDTNYIVTAVK